MCLLNPLKKLTITSPVSIKYPRKASSQRVRPYRQCSWCLYTFSPPHTGKRVCRDFRVRKHICIILRLASLSHVFIYFVRVCVGLGITRKAFGQDRCAFCLSSIWVCHTAAETLPSHRRDLDLTPAPAGSTLASLTLPPEEKKKKKWRRATVGAAPNVSKAHSSLEQLFISPRN